MDDLSLPLYKDRLDVLSKLPPKKYQALSKIEDKIDADAKLLGIKVLPKILL